MYMPPPIQKLTTANDRGKTQLTLYPDNPCLYHDIFVPYQEGIITRLGNPKGFDDITYRDQHWQHRHLIAFGGNKEAQDHGAKVTVPRGYDTLWLRVLGRAIRACHPCAAIFRSSTPLYVRKYIRTYVRTNVRTYVRTYVCTYVRTYVRTYARTYVRTHARR